MTASSPPSSPITLHYETIGNGPPLIILHGLFGSISNWRPLSQALGEHFQLFLVDLRNHGQSPHSDVFNHAVMAEDLRVFMQSQKLVAPYILGHSLGGKVAMQFALTYPDEVAKLITVDMSPRATHPRHRHIIAALQALDFEVASNRRDLDAQLAQRLSSKTLRQFLLTNVRTDEDGRWCWRINLEAIAVHYDEINAAVEPTHIFNQPALFIRGENSDYIEEDDIASIHTMFPHAEVATVKNAGHWVHAEAPEEFARLVLEFFQR